jgi:hypothetical protein
MEHIAAKFQESGFSEWSEVREAVDAITSSSLEHFDPNTIANAFEVVSACELRTRLPSGVKKGYWPTVVLWWEGFELEVFEDRVEVYRFRSDGGTDIWYEEHSPTRPFTPRFLEELECLAA